LGGHADAYLAEGGLFTFQGCPCDCTTTLRSALRAGVLVQCQTWLWAVGLAGAINEAVLLYSCWSCC
jgi:hypothetical protein